MNPLVEVSRSRASRLLLVLAIVILSAGVAHASPGESASHAPAHPPALWSVTPFVLLLAAIALLPILPWTAHWWESNWRRFLVAVSLSLATLLYYAVAHPWPVEQHVGGHGLTEPGEGPIRWSLPATVLANAILGEYVPFLVLLFALYTITGGIRISGDLPAHPSTNTLFLAAGGLLASLIGTTGAAMLLIRPLLETNTERKHVQHTVVFFIFIVCNTGGCLLPIGDPPLFLGYLAGVDFLWTLTLVGPWAFVNAALLGIYYLWDRLYAYPRETSRDLAADERIVRSLTIEGLWPNALWLCLVVLAVATLDSSKAFPGTSWHPWPWLREVVQMAAAGASLALGPHGPRRANRFNFAAILEVAAIFLGIFVCMQPALAILAVQGSQLGIDTPARFFWLTGGISAVLDNAPTYLVFFKTAQTLPAAGAAQAGVAVEFLSAISLGAVFMGALTYIGNGPNFMVKAIAEETGVRMPSFFHYLLYSSLLLPLFAAVAWLWF